MHDDCNYRTLTLTVKLTHAFIIASHLRVLVVGIVGMLVAIHANRQSSLFSTNVLLVELDHVGLRHRLERLHFNQVVLKTVVLPTNLIPMTTGERRET